MPVNFIVINKYYNQKRLKGLTFSKGDIVYLAIKDIIIKRFSKKLDYKYIGLYKIIRKILKNNYELDLLLIIRIYLIFYISLFKNVVDINVIKIGRNNVEIKVDEYEAEKILNIRIKDGRIKYKVK